VLKQALSAFFASIFVFWAGLAAAQSTFLQVEARPDLNSAQELVRAYAANLENVNGFRMASGWYGIALGPYTEDEAVATLQSLRSQGAIPPDSFLTQANAYTQQFFPIGANALSQDPDVPALQGDDVVVAQAPEPEPAPEAAPAPEPAPEP